MSRQHKKAIGAGVAAAAEKRRNSPAPAAALRAARAVRGWSQADTAKRSGIPAKTLREMERSDTGKFPLAQRLKVLKTLGFSFTESKSLESMSKKILERVRKS